MDDLFEHYSTESVDANLLGITPGPAEDSYHQVALHSERGDIAARHYKIPQAKHGLICVGGVGGGWDTPAQGLYPWLCQALLSQQITSLRIRFREPTILDESVHDVLAGIRYLTGDGVDALALIGHSSGGAVVVRAAARSDAVRTVITLATQSYGATLIGQLAPRCSVFVVHGTADEVLPYQSSTYVHELAGEPKRLAIYTNAGHNLDEVADELHDSVLDWITSELRRG